MAGACWAAPAMVASRPARSTRRCSGVPSADARLTDLEAPEPTPTLTGAASDLGGLLDGLLVPVPLILALVFARAVRADSGWEHASRLVAAVVAAACLPAAAMVWRFGI